MSTKDLLAGGIMVVSVIMLGQHLGVQHILRTANAGMSTVSRTVITCCSVAEGLAR
jgi:hypothetical protein